MLRPQDITPWEWIVFFVLALSILLCMMNTAH